MMIVSVERFGATVKYGEPTVIIGFVALSPLSDTLENDMGLLSITRRTGRDAVTAVTGAAAAVTGGAYGAAGGAVTGATRGVSQALGTGPRSTPAAALAIAAVGAAGLVDWPVLLVGSAGALVLRQLRHPPAPHAETPSPDRTPPQERAPIAPSAQSGRSSAPPPVNPRKTTAKPRKTTAPRKASAVPEGIRGTEGIRSTDHCTTSSRWPPSLAGGRDGRHPRLSASAGHSDTPVVAITRAHEITHCVRSGSTQRVTVQR